MKKQDFINKWIGWVSYSDREKLAIEMESDLQEIEKELSQDKWIKIESEKDLPTDKTTQYSTCKDKKVFQSTINCGTVKHWFYIGKITHYQPFIKPNPPTNQAVIPNVRQLGEVADDSRPKPANTEYY